MKIDFKTPVLIIKPFFIITNFSLFFFFNFVIPTMKRSSTNTNINPGSRPNVSDFSGNTCRRQSDCSTFFSVSLSPYILSSALPPHSVAWENNDNI